MSEFLLTPQAAASRLGISRDTLQRLIDARAIEFVRISARTIRFRETAVQQFVRKSTKIVVS